MASQKQIDANRANAQKSRGPRSATGRAKSRLNAIRDNITGQIVTLSDEDRPIFEQLKARLIAGFDPQTPMESKLAHDIAWDTWRLDHLRAIEMNVYALGMEEEDEEEAEAGNPDAMDQALSDARTFRAEAKRFELMSLYEQRMNRNMHRNLATLRDLQKERKQNYERDKKEEVMIARLHEFNEMPIKATTRPSRNGFVFSTEEIAVAAVRQRFVDTSVALLKNTKARFLYGNLYAGDGDGDYFLKTQAERQPISQEKRLEINNTPLEDLVRRRQNQPEEFLQPKQ